MVLELVLAELAAVLVIPLLVDLLIYTVLITTLVSGTHYYWIWIVRKGVKPLSESDDH